MRENQVARHWKILLTLDACRYGATVKELADLMDCDIRTIYRDMDALEEAGFPITTDKTGTGTRYCFAEAYRMRLKLQFTPMELMALSLVTKAQQFLQGTVFHEALESAKGKVESTLGDQYKEYSEAIQSMFQATFRPVRNYGNFRGLIEDVTKALLEKRTMKITYWSVGTRKETDRQIEPYRLWYVNGVFYLIANCKLRKEIRTFMIDRIRKWEITEKKYEISSSFNFDKYTSGGFKVLGGEEEYDVVVRVHPVLRPQMTEQTWHPTQKVQELKDGWLRVSFRLAALDEVKTWVQGYAPYIVVEKPIDLVNDIVSSLRSSLSKYNV